MLLLVFRLELKRRSHTTPSLHDFIFRFKYETIVDRTVRKPEASCLIVGIAQTGSVPETRKQTRFIPRCVKRDIVSFEMWTSQA